MGALDVRGLTKTFAWGPTGPVLRGADLRASPGSLTVVTGGRGAGRTSLLRCLGGTYRPDSGQVVVRTGADPAGSVDQAATDARTLAHAREHLLTIFDGPQAAPPRTTGAAVVARYGHVSNTDATDGLDRLGCAELAAVPVGRLRSHQARRVGLVAALAKPAPIVLLDEPDAVASAGPLAAWVAERCDAGAAVVIAATSIGSWEPDAHGVLEEGVIRWQEP